MHNTVPTPACLSVPLAPPPVKLFIGLPIYAQVPAFFMQCLLALQARKPCPITIQMCQGDGVARSRNQLTADFLASDCTHLLWIDCDLIFSVEHITRLLAQDVDLVGGLYPKKQEGPVEWVINHLPGSDTANERGLQEVRYIGTGFMLIKRRVFETMIAKHPEIVFTADYGTRRQEHDLWPMGVFVYPNGDRRYLSEDWWFCQRARDLGFKVWADCGVVIKHLGTVAFPLRAQEMELLTQAGARAGGPENLIGPDGIPNHQERFAAPASDSVATTATLHSAAQPGTTDTGAAATCALEHRPGARSKPARKSAKARRSLTH